MENQEQKNEIFFSPKRKRMISPRNDGDSISNENITTIVSKHREILSECLNTVNKISSKACSRKSYDVKNSPNKNKLLTNTNFFNKTKDIQESNNAENLEESKFEYSLKILRNRSIMDCNDSFSNNSSSSENEDESFNRLYKISTLQDGRNSKEIQLKGNLHKPKHFLNKFTINPTTSGDEDNDYIGRMSGLTVGKLLPGEIRSPLSSPILINGALNSSSSTPSRISGSVDKNGTMKKQYNVKNQQIPQKVRQPSNLSAMNDSLTFIGSFSSAISNDNITQANHSLTDDMFENNSNSSISFGGMNMTNMYQSSESVANSSNNQANCDQVSNRRSNIKGLFTQNIVGNENELNESPSCPTFTNSNSNMLPPKTPLILNKNQRHEVVMGDLGTPVTEAGSPAVLHPIGEEDEIVFEDDEIELDDEEMVMINNNGHGNILYGSYRNDCIEPDFEDHNYHLFAQKFMDSPTSDSDSKNITLNHENSRSFHDRNIQRKTHFDSPDHLSFVNTSTLSVSDQCVNIGVDISVAALSRESSTSICNKSVNISGINPSDASTINSTRPLPDQSAFEGSNTNDLSRTSYEYSMQDAMLASVGSARKKRPSSNHIHPVASIGINFPSNKDCPPTPLRNINWTNSGGSYSNSSPFSVDLIADQSHADYSTSSSTENCSKVFNISFRNSDIEPNYDHNLDFVDSNMKSSTIGLQLKSNGLSRKNSLLENKVLLSQNELESSDQNSICFHQDFENLGLLGTGTFAEVFKVKRKTGDDRITTYAIKKSKRQFRSKRDREWLMSEVFAMKLLCDQYCAYIVPFIRAWQEDSYFYVQMGYAERGTLKEFLAYLGSKKTKLLHSCNDDVRTQAGYVVPESTIWKVLHDVSSGLQHVNNCGMVHLDIKPANLLITENGCVQIGDFGMSAQIGSKEDGHEGDTRYMAEELLNNSERLPSADIFSLGLTIYEMCCFKYEDEIHSDILESLSFTAHRGLPSEGLLWHILREDRYPPIPSFHTEALLNIVKRTMHSLPLKRPTTIEILSIPEVMAMENVVDVTLSKAPKPVDNRYALCSRSISFNPSSLLIETSANETEIDYTALGDRAFTPHFNFSDADNHQSLTPLFPAR